MDTDAGRAGGTQPWTGWPTGTAGAAHQGAVERLAVPLEEVGDQGLVGGVRARAWSPGSEGQFKDPRGDEPAEVMEGDEEDSAGSRGEAWGQEAMGGVRGEQTPGSVEAAGWPLSAVPAGRTSGHGDPGLGGGAGQPGSRGDRGLSGEGVTERRGSAQSPSRWGCGSRGRGGRWHLPCQGEFPAARRLGPRGEGSLGSSLSSAPPGSLPGDDRAFRSPRWGRGLSTAGPGGLGQEPGGGQVRGGSRGGGAAGREACVFLLRLL